MKEVIRITSVLTTVCLICAFLLSFVYGLAHEKIVLNAKKRVEEAITVLAPEAKNIKKSAEILRYDLTSLELWFEKK